MKYKGPMSASEYARYRRELANFKLAKADDQDPTKAGANRAGHISFPTRAQPSTPAFLQRFIRYIPDETIFAYERVINIIGVGEGGTVTTNPLTTQITPAAGAIDSAGNIYWVEGGAGSSRVRRLNASTNDITDLIAPATVIGGVVLNTPTGITRDSAGNMAITDRVNNRLLYYSVVTTTTLYGVSCAQNAWTVIADSSNVSNPQQLSFAPNGDIYWADFNSSAFRKISKSSGTVAIILTGVPQCRTVYVDSAGNVFFVSGSGNIWMLPAVAGRYFGQNLPAAPGTIYPLFYGIPPFIYGAVTDSFGNLYVAHQTNCNIMKFDFKTGVQTVLAGSGTSGFQPGSVPIASATFGNSILSLFMASNDDLYVCDGGGGNFSIRKIPYENTKVVRPGRWE